MQQEKGYYVKKNEFGRKEWYARFFQRMKEQKMILEDYQQVIEANKDALWKKHPMRVQRQNGEITSIPFKFKLSKNDWKSVIEGNSFAGVGIVRKYHKEWEVDKDLKKEIIGTADENGIFDIPELILDGWRKANKVLYI